MIVVNEGINAPKGFRSMGTHIGIKKVKKDLALILSDTEAVCAACFTKNLVKAAPVLWDMKNYQNSIKGIVVTSGNANACTGQRGEDDTALMAETFAKAVGAKPESILVCSTGVIGVPMPTEIIKDGILKNAGSVSDSTEASNNAAEAICTTDTFVKQIAVRVEIGGKTVTVGGMAKGSGMIHPNMATLLAFVTTDAAISRDMLQKALSDSIEKTFNMISVDGDTSTNDTLICLANGCAGNSEIVEAGGDYDIFKEALDYINEKLAKDVVTDGEGATKLIEMTVSGAKTEKDAKMLCKSVIASNLVKTMMFGEDANCGRILCAMGYSMAEFNPDTLDLSISSAAGEIPVASKSIAIKFDEDKAKEILKEREIKITARLNDGTASAKAWGSDLTYDYVKINGSYRS